MNLIRLCLVLVACCCLTMPNSSAASEAELQAQVDSLQERVDVLESQLLTLMARLDNEGTAPSTSITPPEPAADPSHRPTMRIGGRVKLDMIGNSDSVGGVGGQNRGDVGFQPAAIPFPDPGEDNQLSGNARDSRFWINASTPTPMGDLGAFVELDFGSQDNSGNERVNNSHNPRIRHAYATFRGVTMGQTSSTFQNLAAFPELNDVSGPVGVLNVRQPMIRFQRQSGSLRWSIAAEQPETTVTSSSGARLTYDDDRLPDLVGRLDWIADAGEVSLSAIYRQIRVDDLIEDKATGAGISLSGRWYLQGADNIRLALTHGEGIGRYVSYNGFNDAVFDGNKLDPIPVSSAFLAYQHWWSENWRSNLALGFADADLDAADYSTGWVNQRYLSSHMNLMWSPIPAATFGVEWLHGERQLLNGESAKLNRIQFTSLYRFRSE